MIIYQHDIENPDAIYKTIYEINKEFLSKELVSVVFDGDTIKYVNPFFLSLLLLIHDRHKKNGRYLVIDLMSLDKSKEVFNEHIRKNEERKKQKKDIVEFNRDPRQHYVLRFLLQHTDLPDTVVIRKGKYEKLANDFFYKEIKSIEDREKDYHDVKIDMYGRPRNIILDEAKDRHVIRSGDAEYFSKKYSIVYTTKKHRDNLFLEEKSPFLEKRIYEDKVYKNALPIFKITNFPEFILSDIHFDLLQDKNNLHAKDIRSKIYESMIIHGEDYNRKAIEENFSKLFEYVGSEKTGSLATPFKNLFFELMDNIKKHTVYENKTYANGYFNFYFDKIAQEFRFMIMDDYREGFINTYIKTILKEQDDLKRIDQDIDTSEFGYKREIEQLETNSSPENDIQFLKKLFHPDGVFETHQIPRIVMHFGIPMLMTLISEMGGRLYVRLHRKIAHSGNRYYTIQYPNPGNNPEEEVFVDFAKEKIEGTYYYITIPAAGEYKNIKPYSLDLAPQDYSNILKDKEAIRQEVREFTSIGDKNSKSKHRFFSYEKYMKKKPASTIGDFFREFYALSYQKDIQDAIILDFPVHMYEIYLKGLIRILYQHDHQSVAVRPINVLLFDEKKFKIIFIGGKNKAEFCMANRVIAEHYGQIEPKTNQEICNGGRQSLPNSKFFYKLNKDKDDFIVLPIELINKTSEEDFSIQRSIIDNLKSKMLSIHVDTNEGYHIDQFYRFSSIFQNSHYTGRIAYKMLNAIDDRSIDVAKTLFIGIGRYSSLVLSKVKSIRDINYKDFSKINREDIEKEAKEYLESNKDGIVILYTPVAFSGRIVQELVENNDKYLWFNTIHITLEGEKDKGANIDENLITLEIKKDKFSTVEHTSCDVCKDTDVPLYYLSDDDPFFIENVYIGDYEKKKTENKNIVPLDQLRWYQSIHFGHVHRGFNHYVYYTKTRSFFKHNKKEIKKWLEDLEKDISELEELEQDISEKTKHGKAVILSPLDTTNNDFVTFVDNILFKGDATICRFDKRKFETNFHLLDALHLDKDHDSVFFVDDEMSSGNTMGYFYSLMRSKYPSKSFDGAIIMIDRTSTNDEKILCNYMADDPTDKDSFTARMKKIHTFTKLEIKPIKTEMEECFFCKRREEYIGMFDSIVLDMNRYQLAKRIARLNLIEHEKIDGVDDETFENNVKTYIKMFAIDYVYREFGSFSKIADRNDILVGYEEEENKFKEEIITKLMPSFWEKDSSHDPAQEKEIKKILNYQSEIALHKALAYPKLVYYQSIRRVITAVLFQKMERIVNQDNTDCDVAAPMFDSGVLQKYEENNSATDRGKSFLKNYFEFSKVNEINSLYITAAHINMSAILSKKHIKYYYKVVKSIKRNDMWKKKHELLHSYPFAVKLVCSKGMDRARYFDDELSAFTKEAKPEKDFVSLINALKLESNYHVEKEITSKIFKEKKDFSAVVEGIIDDKSAIDDKILYLKDAIENLLKANNLLSEVSNIYINENMNYHYSKYKDYLEKSVLRDVLNSYERINSTTHGEVKKTYDGYKKDKLDKNINNTWANKYVTLGDSRKKYTVIRLMHVDPKRLDEKVLKEYVTTPDETNKALLLNETMWSIPIGCIVVTHEESTDMHIKVSRVLLSVQSTIVDFFRKELSGEAFKEAIQKVEYEDFYSKFTHGQGDLFQMEDDIDNILEQAEGDSVPYNLVESLKYFASGVSEISILMQIPIEKIKRTKENDLLNIIEGWTSDIEKFTMFVNSKNPDYKKVKIEIEGEKFMIPLEQDILRSIIYELVFNASRHGVTLEGDEYVKILFEAKEKFLKISNRTSIGGDSHTSLGLKKIVAIFYGIGYEMTYNDRNTNDMFEIRIEERHL